jgi:hypothetical protein
MHVGQIVFLAKHLRSTDWKTLSVPRGRSAQFNQYLSDKQAGGDAKINTLDAVSGFAASNDPPK